MLFDDLFYPGNPKRRKEADSLRDEITKTFEDYKTHWNMWADMLNKAFSEVIVTDSTTKMLHDTRITKLKKNIKKNTIKECVDEINAAAKEMNPTMERVIIEMGIAKFLPPEWSKSGIRVKDLDRSNWLVAGKWISLACSSLLAGYLGYHIFTGVVVISALSSAIAGTSMALGTLYAGVLGGLVFSAVFVITDMIASAITGAIERKQLNEAITVLKQVKEQVSDPLHAAAFTLERLCSDAERGTYQLEGDIVLSKRSDDSYAIMRLVQLTAESTDLPDFQKKILPIEPFMQARDTAAALSQKAVEEVFILIPPSAS